MKALNFFRMAAPLFVVVWTWSSGAATPRKVFPVPGSVRICSTGMQTNPVINQRGQIAYRTWPELRANGTGVRDSYDGVEMDFYHRTIRTPDRRCSNLSMSTTLLSCNLHEHENGRFDAKAVEKDPSSTVGAGTMRIHLPRSFGDVWDDGNTSPLAMRHVTSELRDGKWDLFWSGDRFGTNQWIEDSADFDEPTISRDGLAWVRRSLNLGLHEQRSVWYADASTGYLSHQMLGYGRHPSLSSDGTLLAFEEVGKTSTRIAIFGLNPGTRTFVRKSWTPACDVARRPVLYGGGSSFLVAYACWNPEESNWDLHVADPLVDSCAALVDSLNHTPNEEEAPQYDLEGEMLVYSKQDNRSSMQFGIWYTKLGDFVWRNCP